MSASDSRSQGEVERPHSQGPARGYSWPPAEAGNTLALKHGAYQPAVIEEAEQRAVEMIASHAHLDDSDYLAVRAVAIAETRVERIAAWLDEAGMVDPRTGDLRPSVDQLRRWLATASSPRSRAELAVDELHARRSAADLAAQDLEAGRRLREQERTAQSQRPSSTSKLTRPGVSERS